MSSRALDRSARFLMAFAAVLMLTAPALHAEAGGWDRAQALYADGHYLEAAEAAAALETAPGEALAARALLAAATTGRGNAARAHVAQAVLTARRAIARDPGVLEGHLQLAVALGFQGRAIGNIPAHERGLAREARAAIDAALALAPADAWARSLDGSWHLEIVSGAGPLLASALYGADRSHGIAALRAAATDPAASPIVIHQCALQLLAHDAGTFGREAARWLAAAAARNGADAFERHTIRQAERLLRAWRSGHASYLGYEVARQQRQGT